MILFVIFFGIFSASYADIKGIRNLIGEPDYREVRLHWETDLNYVPNNGYIVRYCELQTWGMQRCRYQTVPDVEDDNKIDHEEKYKTYSTEIRGLRMATTYSFEVKKNEENKEREDRADGEYNSENMIVIPTKGFSAKATQCLPHASEIEVSTGPYFGVRIAVESSDGEKCALDGEPNSPRDTYTLRINHEECGSQVNETTVATFVIVQENLPILTHSTRRFLVLCSYQPETLTVRAGLNLPTSSGRGQAAQMVHYEENYLGRRSRNLRTGRLLQKPQALVGEEVIDTTIPEASNSSIVPAIVIAMLAIAGVIGLIAIVLRISNMKIQQDLDNISIASEMSVSSCSTITDFEAVCETNSRHKQAKI